MRTKKLKIILVISLLCNIVLLMCLVSISNTDKTEYKNEHKLVNKIDDAEGEKQIQESFTPNEEEQVLIDTMKDIAKVLDNYYVDNNLYPTDLLELDLKAEDLDNLKNIGFDYQVYNEGRSYKISVPLRNQLVDIMKNDKGEDDNLYEIIKNN